MARYTPAKLDAIRRLYPEGGAAACRAAMPAHSLASIIQVAGRIGVKLSEKAYSLKMQEGAALRAASDKKAARLRSYKYTKPGQDSPRVTSPRKCLRCGNDFESEGPMNRICGACKSLNAKEYEPNSGG